MTSVATSIMKVKVNLCLKFYTTNTGPTTRITVCPVLVVMHLLWKEFHYKYIHTLKSHFLSGHCYLVLQPALIISGPKDEFASSVSCLPVHPLCIQNTSFRLNAFWVVHLYSTKLNQSV